MDPNFLPILFIFFLKSSHNSMVTLEDGRRALALALQIVEDIHKHGSRINLEKLASL